MTYGIVYKTTNLINGKTYIGQTTRLKASNYIGSGVLLKKAIEKYSKINFKKEIICECKDKDQLDRMERLYISLLKPDYNIENGGNTVGKISEKTKKSLSISHKGLKLSQETKDKISKANKGKKRSKEQIEKISKSLKGKSSKRKGVILSQEIKNKIRNSQLGEKSSWYGRKHTKEELKKISKGNKNKIVSEETRKKMSNIKKGKPSPLKGRKCSDLVRNNMRKAKINSTKNYIKIVCIETREIFKSILEASIKLNINKSSISSCCSKKLKSAGKLHFCYYEDYINNNYNTNPSSYKTKKIICLETNEIFNSIKEASNTKNISVSALISCCKGKSKTSGGYHWEYYNGNN
jgi:group I intron endonuclease